MRICHTRAIASLPTALSTRREGVVRVIIPKPSPMVEKRPAENESEPPAKSVKLNDGVDSRIEKERLKQQEKERKEAERLRAKQEREEKRLAEKAKKDLERQQERERKEAEREVKRKEKEEEKARKEAERDAEKARKEAEREAEKARKEAEKEAERARKEAEKEAEKARKEAEKRKEEENQLKINTFFKAKPVPKSEPEPAPACDFDKYFLPYHQKANSKYHEPVQLEPVSPPDSLEWLKSEPFMASDVDYISPEELADRLNLVTEDKMASLVAQLDIRHLQFAENLRPPYVGTVNSVKHDALIELTTDSTLRLLDLNYDYDSDYEWFQEEDDGEDLGDDDGSEEEEEDDDMDEFVASDDEIKRMQVTGPLTATVLWNDGAQNCFEEFTAELLCVLPIDPLKDYWTIPKEKSEKASESEGLSADVTKRLLMSIQGRKMNQTLLVELLKQEFPQIPKAAILSTVRSSAKRLGGKEPDKKWVVDEQLCNKYEIPTMGTELIMQ